MLQGSLTVALAELGALLDGGLAVGAGVALVEGVGLETEPAKPHSVQRGGGGGGVMAAQQVSSAHTGGGCCG